MEDTEMSEQQLPEASQVNLGEAGAQQQQSSQPTQDKQTTETKHSPQSGIAEDNSLTLPTDVNMSENPALPDKPDKKSSNDANGQQLEKKNNGESTPLPCGEPLTPKSGPEPVEKPNNWLLDPEVHKKTKI